MNIVTFATPVSVAPPKLWMVSLYDGTRTKNSFFEHGQGVLQLLKHNHKQIVPLLGKRRGYEIGYSKAKVCSESGMGPFEVRGDGSSSSTVSNFQL
mmetsp:Transcript_996/g.1302  ORF Transcript_996/g.1302 Transcript_996/m.1302 type:complete len:96 (-) Transcript_996:494-781(-)